MSFRGKQGVEVSDDLFVAKRLAHPPRHAVRRTGLFERRVQRDVLQVQPPRLGQLGQQPFQPREFGRGDPFVADRAEQSEQFVVAVRRQTHGAPPSAGWGAVLPRMHWSRAR